MGTYFFAIGILTYSAVGLAGDICQPSLPPTLPLNGTVAANTCAANPNEPCDSTTYPSPTATSRFTLDQASIVNFTMSGAPGYDPAIYLSGGECDEATCGPELPAGSYCLTVTASEESAIGACGCFTLMVETVEGAVFDNGFDG